MANKIIAISREFGSGGRSIGKKVAAELGIPFYDMETIDRVAFDEGLPLDYTDERELWESEKTVINGLAETCSCVIVGRCADYILRNNPNCIKVYIHSSLAHRMNYVTETLGIKAQQAERVLREKDSNRRAFYEYLTGVSFGDAKKFDVSLNSSELGYDLCADILVNIYKNK